MTMLKLSILPRIRVALVGTLIAGLLASTAYLSIRLTEASNRAAVASNRAAVASEQAREYQRQGAALSARVRALEASNKNLQKARDYRNTLRARAKEQQETQDKGLEDALTSNSEWGSTRIPDSLRDVLSED